MADNNKKKRNPILQAVLLVCLVAVSAFLIVLRLGRISSPSPENESETASPSAPLSTEAVAPVETPPSEKKPLTLAVSELMPANKCCLADEDGDYSDWVELINTGSETVSLTGCAISDKAGSGWVFPSGELAPGERIIVFCSGKDKSGSEYHTDFSLKSTGETLCILDACGEAAFSCTYPACGDNEAVILGEDISLTYFATPGYDNDDYEGYIASNDAHGALVLSELAPYNSSYAKQNGEYYDWVELLNTSASPVELSDYYLGDDIRSIRDFSLPAVTLAPGERFTVFCSGDASLTNDRYVHAPFELGSDGDAVYLYLKSGELSDRVYIQDVPLNGSIGRSDAGSGFFYFTSPTPGESNGAGNRRYADMPASSVPQGVYSDSLTVELSGKGSIYYTLNGSAPTTSSSLYSAPITVDKSTVVRAICVEGDKLPSHIASFSYILDSSELPIVSLSMDPGEFKSMWGNPNVEKEVLGHVSFFDGEETFDIDCGTKLHGATSKFNAAQKSMKLCFRGRYAGQLEHDIFGNGVTGFASVLLRSAQEDYYSTQMHDTVMHRLAAETFPELPAQDYRYCSLYLNGEYYGLYCIREAHSSTHYANNYGFDVDTVDSWKISWSEYEREQKRYQTEIYDFIVRSDMSDSANYERAKQLVNIDSYIGFTILQAYCGNFDCLPGNIRFYRSSTDGQTRIALLDLDLGWFGTYYGFDVSMETYESVSGVTKALLKNSEFREYFLTRLSEELRGGLSDEHVLETIDSIADEIRSEIPRDRQRWGGTLEGWEKMVRDMRDFAEGRAKTMAKNIRSYIYMTDDEWNRYFAEVK